MVLTRYGGVAGLLILIGTLVGAALFLLMHVVMPPDRGEEGVALTVFMAIFGGAIGAGTAFVAALAFLLSMLAWTRGGHRSVGSRAVIGGSGAAAGAALVWVCVGIAWNSPYARHVWGAIAGFCALLAAIVAVPATARAARRADSVTPATV
ncbi:hypothetical protein [Microbacterium immunditiarum]|uniref:Putative membrane protein YccC n=1 Tax=Microbacterium immunditiarum TaxID=337480 RepID=A0A7Y9KJW8_9MICO|nr:hypothetical protein [Microbacterium immunditiarum]NYE20215.1 putative membrane protein YccC [Microbacterium immunditiarum]